MATAVRLQNEMTTFIQLQITYPNHEEAIEVAKRLVASKLVACAQVVGGVESCYVWKGEFCVDGETLLLCKTRSKLFDLVVKEITNTHSYECPQIVAVPLTHVSPDYAVWLDDNIASI